MLGFNFSHALFSLNLRDQQSPISAQLREAEPHGPAAQPEDPANLHRVTAEPSCDRTQPFCQPAQSHATPEPCDPAACPSATDLHPREQVRHGL